MSDFLDRVATRAIGSESMLSPRLPSLFEPAGHAETAAAEEAFQVRSASPNERTPEQMPPRPRQADGRPAPPETPALALTPRPATENPMQAIPRERVVVTDGTRQAASGKPFPREPAAKPAPERVMPRADLVPAGDLQQMRETHVLHERTVIESAHDDRLGVLLPPGGPVFATRHEPAPRPAGAAPRSPAGPFADMPREAREPAVHVSIGRLEVRAAPAGAPAPRRQEAPRPSSLDDYLRQRGGHTP